MAVTQTQIGAWLAAKREAAGLTQMEAASRLGRQSGLVSKWERGELRMSAESFFEAAALYGADVREVLAIPQGLPKHPAKLTRAVDPAQVSAKKRA